MTAGPRDDVACVVTITTSLNDIYQIITTNAANGAPHRKEEQEAMDLMDLLPPLVANDPMAQRLSRLLFQLPEGLSPLASLLQFLTPTQPIADTTRTLTAHVIRQLIVACTAPDVVGIVAPKLRDQLTRCGAVQMLLGILDTITAPWGNTALTAIAELIFVLAMQVASIRDSLCAEGAVLSCCRAMARYKDLELRGYLSAALRVFVDVYADHFTSVSVDFFPMALSTILESSTSRYITVLMWECIREVLAHFGTSFWALVANSTKTSDALVLAIQHFALADTADVEATMAALDVAERVLTIEPSSPLSSSSNAPPVLLPLFAAQSVWTDITTSALAASQTQQQEFPQIVRRLRLLRMAVGGTDTCAEIEALRVVFLDSFPRLCSMLAPATTPLLPTAQAMVAEASYIISIMLAKSVACRQDVSVMVKGYEAWAFNLLGTLRFYVGAAPFDALRGMVLVDCNQSVLTDGDQARTIEGFDENRIAFALLVDQERRVMAKQPPAMLDTQLLSMLRSTNARKIADLTYRLCVGVMIGAAMRTLGSASSSAETSAATPPPKHDVASRAPPTPRTPRTPPPAVQRQQQQRLPKPTARTPPPPSNQPTKQPTQARQPPSTHRRSRSTGISAILGEAPKPKTPFRPASPSSRHVGYNRSPTPTPRLTGDPEAAQAKRLTDTITGLSGTCDEYMTMALLMHLPIMLGVHYNRQSRRSQIRKIEGPLGAFVQPIYRNTAQTWTVADVNNGDLYVLFLPFHKISPERLEQELATVGMHLSSIKRLLVTTPNNLRSRRWFLHDMYNYILPKTELLLRDFKSFVEEHGADDVVYQMGLIRMLDETDAAQGGAFSVAAAESDLSMPRELLRFSSGKFKDVLHSGNLVYAVKRLRQHYYNAQGTEGGMGIGSGLENAAIEDSAAHAAVGNLHDIDAEIAKLERQAQADGTWENDADAGAADDVEPLFARPLPNVSTSQAAPSTSEGLRSSSPGEKLRSQLDGMLESTEVEGLPQHLLQQLSAKAEEDNDPIELAVPGMQDFDAVYAAVEQQQRSTKAA